MFDIIEKFAELESLQIEGLDGINKKFFGFTSNLQRKPYDILDHRKNVCFHDVTDESI